MVVSSPGGKRNRASTSSARALVASDGDRGRYRAGSVLKVRMHNFMTYSDCWFAPDRKLNLLLGPNGSGKSTIVCALCIGLAASPRLLGRADNVKDFVKRGESSGWVEITLQKRDKNERDVVTIRRTLLKESNKSAWLLNGRNSGLHEVQALVKRLNVQIENLCQFLPQDKVVSFAKLTPEALLKETERALSSTDEEESLYAIHQKLEASHSESVTLSKMLSNHKEKLEVLEGQKAELERDVEKVKKKKALEEDKGWAEKKMKWVRYEVHKKNYLESKAALTAAKQNKSSVEKLIKKTESNLNGEQKAQLKCTTKASQCKKEINSFARQMANKSDKVEEYAQIVQRLEVDVETFQQSKREHESNVRKVRSDIAMLERELEAWQEKERKGESSFTPEHQRKLQEIKDEMQKINEESLRCKQALRKRKNVKQRTQIALDSVREKLTNVKDTKRVRLNALVNNSRGNKGQKIRQAWDWIQRNQGRLRGRVYGPLITEVNVRNSQHATFLENQVPGWLWEAFVTSYGEDRDMLKHELKGLSVLFSTNSNQPMEHPLGDASTYKDLDVTHTLDEVFDAPLPVKNVMKDTAGIHTAYVGTNYTERQIEQAAAKNMKAQWRNTNIRNLYTPDHHFVRNVSRYDGHESLNTTGIRPGRLLNADVDASGDEASSLQREQRDLVETLRTLDSEIEQIQDQQKAFEERLEILERDKKKLIKLQQQVKRQIQQIKNQIMRQNKTLANLEQEEYTEEKEIELERELKSTIKKQVAKLVSCVDSYGEYTNSHFKSVPVHMELEAVKAKCNRLQHQLRSQRHDLDQADTRVRQVQVIFDEEKEKLRDLKNDAEKSAPLNDDSRERFAKLPSSFEELDDLIINLGSEINSLIVADPNVVQDHNEILASIEELTARVAKGEKEFNSHEGGRLVMHDKWLNPLLEIVQKLNIKFSSLFSDLGFVGEVRLRKDEDYSKYAIEIWVKFREEDELSILTSTVQSGGERSVSTIIYLIALQKLTPCPFRVIDEINQGMDAVNERLVFKKLVEEACTPNSPQCFLLTPKLLPGLYYTEDVTVLNIFNGPYTKECDQPEWKRQRFLESDVSK